MSECVIQIDTQAEIEKIIRQLDTLPNRLKAPSVLADAINAAANEMKRKIGQKTRKRYAISDKKILTDKKRGGMYLERAKGADTSATLISRGGMVEVMAYMTRRNTETTAAMLKVLNESAMTALDYCSCPDFDKRSKPCKHIYFLALQMGYTSDDFYSC